MTVNLLARMYLAHARKEFNGQHGHKETATVRHSFRPLVELYGSEHPSQIGPLRLRACRQFWIEQEIARTTIQARMQRLRKAWRWGRSVGLIDADLPDIGPVRYGHAPEPEPVRPVELSLVESTLPHLSKPARGLIRLIMYTGMRPGEACSITVHAIDVTCNPWVYRPRHHKTAWRGAKREIYLGPKAQMLLTIHLAAVGVRVAKATTSGVSAMDGVLTVTSANATASASLFQTARGLPWKPSSLYMAVFNACRRHDLPHWHPNMLRHTFATQLRQRFGIDAAQVALGHTRTQVTQRYAEPHRQAAIEAVLAVG